MAKFKIKVGNKYWNFEESRITSIQNENTFTDSAMEADSVADFLRQILPGKTVKVEDEI